MAESDPWKLYERLQSREVASLSPAERRFVAVGTVRTEVNNGGFDQYFFNSAGDLALDAVGAARGAGAADLAALIERAISLLDLSELGDRDARQDALEDLDEDTFEELDEAFNALEASLDFDAVMRAVMP